MDSKDSGANWQEPEGISEGGAGNVTDLTPTSPHFSSLVYCVAAIIHPGCVSLGRPPRRTVKVRLRRPRSQALPGRPLQRLATTSDEKFGLVIRRELR